MYSVTCTYFHKCAHPRTHTHRPAVSHPPGPVVAAGAGVAAAPPSAAAADASVAGAGVAKASEVHTNPSGGQKHPERHRQIKKQR